MLRSSDEITEVILHNSDSDIPAHDYISVIRKWHVEENGWDDVAYHYFIRNNGTVNKGRDIFTVGAHCKGHNKRSIGICLSGRDKFSDVQFLFLKQLVMALCDTFPITKVSYHNEYNKGKTCPNFSRNWIRVLNEELQTKAQ